MDKENEDIDSQNNDDDKDIDENLENTEEETEEEYSDEETDVDVLKKQKKDLFVRAKKAETELKKRKAVDKETVKAKKDDSSNDSEDTLTRDEAMLIAGGVDAEDLEQLKAIRKGTGVSLSEAVKNPMYEAYKEKKVKEAKRKKAQLGAGSGLGGGESDDINKPGLTEEEHRKLWSK